MIYAAVLFCNISACWGITDDRGPYDSAAECEARLHEMRTAIAAALGHQPGARMRAVCGPVEDVRRLIPGAFPGVAEGVLL